MTPEQIRQTGLEAVYQALGAAGLLRFLQQFELGTAITPPSASNGWADIPWMSYWLRRLNLSRKFPLT